MLRLNLQSGYRLQQGYEQTCPGLGEIIIPIVLGEETKAWDAPTGMKDQLTTHLKSHRRLAPPDRTHSRAWPHAARRVGVLFG